MRILIDIDTENAAFADDFYGEVRDIIENIPVTVYDWLDRQTQYVS